MSIKLGSTNINKRYLGTTVINKAYLGTTVSYGSGGGGGGGGGGNVPIWAGIGTSDTSSSAVTLTFMDDGTISGAAASQWLTSTPDTATSDLYEIRWTSFSSASLTNSTSGMTQNTWYPLSSFRIFSISGTQGVSDRTATLAISIRHATDLTPVYSGNWVRTLVGSG